MYLPCEQGFLIFYVHVELFFYKTTFTFLNYLKKCEQLRKFVIYFVKLPK